MQLMPTNRGHGKAAVEARRAKRAHDLHGRDGRAALLLLDGLDYAEGQLTPSRTHTAPATRGCTQFDGAEGR
jgi:hypothetical protein